MSILAVEKKCPFCGWCGFTNKNYCRNIIKRLGVEDKCGQVLK